MTVGLLGFILSDMRIINRYFLRQLIAIFVMLLLVLTGLAWMVQIMSMMKMLMNYGIAIGSFLGLTMLMVPFIVSIIVPFVAFIAVIFVYNKLISDNEVTVMMASTLSPGQLARPALIMATVLTVLHLVLNAFIVPATQARFYDTQWNLRYGLAHLKLQEAAFTEIAPGLVVYVDKVSGHDLSQVMLSDMRSTIGEVLIFAERGKLVATERGLSIVMNNGSLQVSGDIMTTGTFDDFDMDLNVAERADGSSFRVRRVPTLTLITRSRDNDTAKRHKTVMNELATRLVTPFMNIVLALLCTLILLRTSLLRRRASMAPATAVAAMAVVMATYMSATNMIASLTGLGILFAAVMGIIVLLGIALFRK